MNNIHEVVEWLLDNGFKLRCGINPLKYDKEDLFLKKVNPYYVRRTDTFYCNINLNYFNQGVTYGGVISNPPKKLFGDTLQIGITINYLQPYKRYSQVSDIHLNNVKFDEMKKELGYYFLDIKRNIDLEKLMTDI
jgi:hypothetical protein